MLTLFLLVVFLLTAGLTWLQGLWKGLLTLVNVLLAGLVATIFFEPITTAIVESSAQMTYLLDFLVLWGLFALAITVFRIVTEIVSRERVQFHPMVELVGRSITALLIGYLMVMFTNMTLHTAPIQASPFNGAWTSPGEASFVGLSPDAQWLSFVRGQSQMGLAGSHVFDEDGSFVQRYYSRRQALESEAEFLVQ